MKVINNFLQEQVLITVQNTYGIEYSIKKDRILCNFKTYPYPKDVGYWFVLDNNLYMVIDNGTTD